MTKRHSNMNWRGAIYNALRKAPEGIQGFCNWATAFRDRTIAPKTLYKRLDGADARERMTIEDAELITEYLMRQDGSRDHARDWIFALGARFDLAVIPLDPGPAGGAWPDEINAILEKALTLGQQHGEMSGLLMEALRDREISVREADEIEAVVHAKIRMLLRLARNVQRAAGTGQPLASLEPVE